MIGDDLKPGAIFDRLTIEKRSEPRVGDTNYVYFDCRCSCGRVSLHVRSDGLRTGRSRSCGCLRAEVARTCRQRGIEAKAAREKESGLQAEGLLP